MQCENLAYFCVHSQRDDLTLFSANWTAAEELRLLDGVRLAGYANWNEVALYVRTKSSTQCSKHYRRYYVDQPHELLPSNDLDMITVTLA